MSGHSKWSSIKHRKGAADAKRGKHFTKLARAITVAAREGGGDPDGNPALATAVQKARDASMPKDNIQRAIDRGTGAGADAEAIERVVFEGYGPGGAAILVEALTDNRNRTSAEVRHAFSKHGGNLGEPGSVAWIFEKRGVVVVDGDRYGEDDLIVGDRRRRRGRAGGRRPAQGDLRPRAASAPSARRSRPPGSRSSPRTSRWSRTAPSRSARTRRRTLLRLLDALDEQDDVNEVHANFDIPEEVLERAAA